MAGFLNDTDRERFLTLGWNNVITAALGVPTLLFAFFALTSESLSDRATFIGLVIAASFY